MTLFVFVCLLRIYIRRHDIETVRDEVVQAQTLVSQQLTAFEALNGFKMSEMESVSISLNSTSTNVFNHMQPSVVSRLMSEVSAKYL